MTENQPGIDRRRVIQGALWAAPAIVIATGIPARAASTDPEGQIIVTSAQSQFQGSYFDSTLGSNITATTLSIFMQLADEFGGGGVTAGLISVQLEVVLPYNIPDPSTLRWGFDGTEGGDANWSLTKPVESTDGGTTTTVTLTYNAVPISAAGTFSLAGFFAESPSTVGDMLSYTVTGIDEAARVLITPGSITVA